LDLSFIGKLGPDLPGFSGAGEGVHACSASFLPHGDLAIPKVAL